MESTSKDISKMDHHLEHWNQCSVNDLLPWDLHSQFDQTIDASIEELYGLKERDDEESTIKKYKWSIELRDLMVLLRDALLGVVKYEQHKLDNQVSDPTFKDQVATTIRKATEDFLTKDRNGVEKSWKHQISPVEAVIEQLGELKTQGKKILRSHDKVKDFRNELDVFLRDFNIQLSRHASVVDQIENRVGRFGEIVGEIPTESDKTALTKVVERLTLLTKEVENIPETDSVDILQFPDNQMHTFPVDVQNGQLAYKSINMRSELSRWFSSNVYTRLIELEKRRKLAQEHALMTMNDIRTKMAGQLLAEKEVYHLNTKDFKSASDTLNKSYILPLVQEKKSLISFIDEQLKTELVASNIYNKKQLFLPYSGAIPVDNLSKEAYRRITTNTKDWYKKTKDWIYDFLSRFIEMKQTTSTAFIANKLRIDQEDDRFYLFLKSGYLGKSFTVERPKLTEKIVENYAMWREGFAESALLFGPMGVGKSTLIGMLAHSVFQEEVVQPRVNESYFLDHTTFEATCNLKEVIENIYKNGKSQRVICCIDDLEHWHNSEIALYDNISALFDCINAYRRKIYFVVSCTKTLRDKISRIKDLNTVFSLDLEVGTMSAPKIKEALLLRAKAVQGIRIEAINKANEWTHMIRVSKGNIGSAMLELCRLADSSYEPDMKSKDFKEVIRKYGDLLRYVLAYGQISVRHLSEVLTSRDYKSTIASIDFLVAKKILTRPRAGVVGINFLLRHDVERIILNSEK